MGLVAALALLFLFAHTRRRKAAQQSAANGFSPAKSGRLPPSFFALSGLTPSWIMQQLDDIVIHSFGIALEVQAALFPLVVFHDHLHKYPAYYSQSIQLLQL